MAMHKPIVIVDSSALVALLKIDDADHAMAINIMDKIIFVQGFRVLLPVEVLAETLNIIGKKEGKLAAVTAGRTLLDRETRGEVLFAPSVSSILASALDIQETASGGPGFVDCLVMAHADQQQTSYVFGFDTTFKKNGYRLPC